MKKLCILAVILITAFFIRNNNVYKNEKEVRGIFISYLEYEKYFNNKDIEKEIDNMFISIKKYYINTIYLQVRINSDSIYYSKIFPYTQTISNKIDILDLFIKKCKSNNIKLYAWINPYRISTNTNIDSISKDNPAYIYLNTNNVKIIDKKGIYYNPASSVVKNLIIAGVYEIINNYDVDGILFDDYFYPNDDIDLEEYKKENNIAKEEFHLNQVNDLISRVYKMIKSVNKNIEFGISPDGNIDNNYFIHYADIKTWLKEDGYIDFIMPQLYYGFNHETKPFEDTLNEWNNLIKNNTKLIVALPLYKIGTRDIYAKSGENEWIESKSIIKRQIEVSRSMSNYYGYSLYRMEYLTKQDTDNLRFELDSYVKYIEKSKKMY